SPDRASARTAERMRERQPSETPCPLSRLQVVHDLRPILRPVHQRGALDGIAAVLELLHECASEAVRASRIAAVLFLHLSAFHFALTTVCANSVHFDSEITHRYPPNSSS